MAPSTLVHRRWPVSLASVAIILGVAMWAPTEAAQIDIVGPPGSVAFGHSVATLPNGNVVVTDPQGPTANIGAVYLYSPGGHLISTLTGSSSGDAIGSGGGDGAGVVVLASGDFVVVSPYWHNGAAANAGAVTWVDGTNGLSDVVSSSNSLVGTTSGDEVGLDGVTALGNGNYVVASSNWNNGSATQAGAVTWANGNTGLIGSVSSGNSLVGTTAADKIGIQGITTLKNGNYVVPSPNWHNGASASAGAATWANGSTGISGAVSASNSIVGATSGDLVGNSVYALSNGNYVVASAFWHNGAAAGAGAVTWGNGVSGLHGVVSASNSLVGTTANDNVGFVTALANGNYVVTSPGWHNGSIFNAGAATWANGDTGLSGAVSSSNSLVGTVAGDRIGFLSATGLSNGNYVVLSPTWHNGSVASAGAATWANGATGLTGTVSVSNSLVGSTTADEVGSTVVALSNGNYVVASPMWSKGSIGAMVTSAGAVTWGNGNTGVAGAVSTSNSLVGTTSNDQVGLGVTALTNGNYVVGSPDWQNIFTANAGAATWANGNTGLTGSISASNSLVGTSTNDYISSNGVAALSNGNYVVTSPLWNNGAITDAGAVTWGNGGSGVSGAVSTDNSFVGTQTNDRVGSAFPGETALSDNNFVIVSKYWSNRGASAAGAVTLASGGFRLTGTVQPLNSVLGSAPNGGNNLVFSYDATHRRLAVGRPSDNIVSVFMMDQVFADGFE